MAKKFPLQPLVSLSQKQNDAAIRKLGQLNQQQQAAKSKLDALLQFRKEYQERLRKAEQEGISQSEWRNFKDFISRLDEAIAQQKNNNEQAGKSVYMGRRELQETQRKMKSFQTLAQRYDDNEKMLAEKIEQRGQDEHTGRAVAIKAVASQNEE